MLVGLEACGVSKFEECIESSLLRTFTPGLLSSVRTGPGPVSDHAGVDFEAGYEGYRGQRTRL